LRPCCLSPYDRGNGPAVPNDTRRRTLNEKSLGTLEFDKVIARLVDLTSFAVGRERAASLTPSADYLEVLRRQRLTAEARRLRVLKPNVGLGGARDVRVAVQKAALGGVLEPGELLDVLSTVQAVRSLRGNLTRLSLQLPLLADIAKTMEDLGDLIAEIGSSISLRGEVVDSASSGLGHIRAQVRATHDRLQHRLQEILANASARGVAQEAIVTLRDGRYVIPVKADFRGQLRGIVHDVSASGATVFIEPLAVVELGNAWREAQLEEQREVERILRRLSGLVGEDAPDLAHNLVALGELDLALAKARLGDAMRATELPYDGSEQPWLVRGPAELTLIEARHPLLSGAVVPISLQVGGAFRVLLITGPNTGGKTVALKTAGLLTLMAQAGLPIPALEGSQVPVFADVFADIGDEQSIEQSLSTFSSHMRTIIAILGEARANTLALLDELGAGTDPVEGSALARAVVEQLLDSGATVVATTHHGELKAFAHATPGVQNASVEFDAETLAPTYRLRIGLPGRSNALAIAQRLGMPLEIVARARAEVGPEQLHVESLLTEIQRERDEAVAARRAERNAAREAEEIRRQLAGRLDAIEDERDALIERTRRDIEEELGATREELREASRRLQRAERERAEFDAAAAALAVAEHSIEKVRQRQPVRRRQPVAPKPAGLPPETVQPGDRIWVGGLEQPGESLSGPDERGQIEVQLGALRTRVRLSQLERVERPSEGSPRVVVSIAPRGAVEPPPLQIEVRGQRVEEALPKVEEYLENAYQAGMPFVRIVHGKGTGTLRRVVRERLANSPIVTRFETAEPRAGGEGVTVVHLAV
jgi:DNA mismatch repair protein MutS2